MVIKISDEGGGIKRSDMNKVWSYLYTTADVSSTSLSERIQEIKDQVAAENSRSGSSSTDSSGTDTQETPLEVAAHFFPGSHGYKSPNHVKDDEQVAAPMAGLGYGLPLSR